VNRPAVRLLHALVFISAFLASAVPAQAGFIAFTDRASFLAALGAPALGENYESYGLAPVANGSTLGSFLYTYDPSAVQPVIVPGGFGGQALGGPFDAFVGGDAVTLSFAGSPLRAFGADFYYGPSFEPVPGAIYQLRVDDGAGAGAIVGNENGLPDTGGSFFLGLIADPGFEFATVSLRSVAPLDQDGNPYLVPAYQVDNLAYQAVTAVPEPASLTLLMTGGALMAARRRATRMECRRRAASKAAPHARPANGSL
jgi:hypothetical protein